MAYRLTARAAASPNRFTLRCPDCGTTFRLTSHDDTPPPLECPVCAQQAVYEPPKPGLLTVKSKAMDIAQTIAEEDYGLTDIRDNQRQGDVAAVGPAPMQTAEREAVIRELVEAGVAEQTAAAVGQDKQQQVQSFWQAGGGLLGDQNATKTVAAAGAAEAKALGSDPLDMIVSKDGSTPMLPPPKMRVMGRMKGVE